MKKVLSLSLCLVLLLSLFPAAMAAGTVYTVSYDANGGENAPRPQAKNEGVDLKLREETPDRADSDPLAVYTVTLDPNGGTVSRPSITAPIRLVYSFNSWNTESDGSGTSYMPGGMYTEDADLTLYAIWDSSEHVRPVTLPTPTREEYSFKGWAEDRNAQSGVIGSYTPSGNVTLYAIWKDENETPVVGNSLLSLGSASGEPGDTVELSVELNVNPGMSALSFGLSYDAAVLRFVGGEDGSLSGWSFDAEAGSAQWTGEEDSKATGTVVSLRFQIRENATGGESRVRLTGLSASNRQGKEVKVYGASGTVTVTVPEPPVGEVLLGDVNADGTVNGKDLIVLRRYAAGVEGTEIDQANSDLNGDGTVNGKDLILLRRLLAG